MVVKKCRYRTIHKYCLLKLTINPHLQYMMTVQNTFMHHLLLYIFSIHAPHGSHIFSIHAPHGSHYKSLFMLTSNEGELEIGLFLTGKCQVLQHT